LEDVSHRPGDKPTAIQVMTCAARCGKNSSSSSSSSANVKAMVFVRGIMNRSSGKNEVHCPSNQSSTI
jgi:hypothetical protein